MALREVVLPETKPETEWVRGRALRKMSPKRDHSRLQGELTIALGLWARGRGEVGPEWRFRIAPPGEERRPLVPDIAFVSAERLRGVGHDDLQAPAFAPTVAVEIVSPGDRRVDLESKIDVYLRAGTALVAVVEPRSRTIELHDVERVRVLQREDVLAHEALPGFRLAVGAYFDEALKLSGPTPDR